MKPLQRGQLYWAFPFSKTTLFKSIIKSCTNEITGGAQNKLFVGLIMEVEILHHKYVYINKSLQYKQLMKLLNRLSFP